MDKKDRIILYELAKNSRVPYSQLAKASRSSQETGRYRVNRLTKEGIIKNFIIITNMKSLGFSIYQIFFKLQNVREIDKNNIVKNLINNKNVAWVANFEGNYDLGCIVVVKDQIELQKIVERLYQSFNNKIMNKTISLLLEGKFFPKDYLLYQKRPASKVSSYSDVTKKIELDELDKKICLILANNARISLVEIGQELKRSADAIALRLKKLNNSGFITGYTTDIDQQKLNQIHYKILLHLNDLSEDKIKSLLSFIHNNIRVTAVMKTLASWDYEIDLEVENPFQLKQFTMELTTQFSDLVRNYETLQIIDMPKFSFYLSGFN